MTKEKMEYRTELERLSSEVENFIDHADILGDGKERLRFKWVQFCSTAISDWDYSHPHDKD